MNIKNYPFLEELKEKDKNFKKILEDNLLNGKIRRFDETEWNLIKNQNCLVLPGDSQSFYEMFEKQQNIGNCAFMAPQLSYSYDNVDIVSGTLNILKGTKNAEKEGGHVWLETDKDIIDTSFLLIIDKDLKEELGYKEEQRITKTDLKRNEMYQMRKEIVQMQSSKKTR